MTTRDDIRRWLEKGKSHGASYVIVVVDDYDHEDYPVHVPRNQNVHEVRAEYDGVDMQRIMEVYWLGGDIEHQLALDRSFTYAPEDEPQPSAPS